MTAFNVKGTATLNQNQTADFKPSTSGEEWIIHNIYIAPGSDVKIFSSDGVDDILIVRTSNSMLSYSFHCDTADYLKVQNMSATITTIRYNGMKVA